MKTIYMLFVSVILSSAPVHSQTVFPDADWEYATPQSQGIDSVKFADAMIWLESALSADRDGTSQMMVIRNGRVIWEGDNTDSVHTVYSCTKTYVSTVLGLAIDEGLCSLDTKVASVLPELDSLYPDVTFRHLITQTSGYNAANATPYVFDTPRFGPGTMFEYGASWFSLVTRALTVLTGETMEDFLNRKIGSHIGMDSTGWNWSRFGVVDSGFPEVCGVLAPDIGVRISADHMARMGLLLLNEGIWDAETLLTPGYVREMSSAQVAPDVPPYDDTQWYTGLPGMYGLGCWTNAERAEDGKRTWANAPAATWAFQGNKTNYCLMIPGWDMVIVREGEHKILDPWNVFIMKIGEALETSGIAALPDDVQTDAGLRAGTYFSMRGEMLRGVPVRPGVYLRYDGNTLVKTVVVE